MKTRPVSRSLGLGVLAGLLVVSSLSRAAEPDALGGLDAALKESVSFEYGQGSGALDAVERVVNAASKDPELRPQVEERLVGALAGEATRDAKEFLCRQLFTIGTARAVPQLAKLLLDPELSHAARFALGRIPAASAGAALRDALSKTSGKLQIGIVGTLGSRKDREATGRIAALLESPDPAIAAAAATALGQIGGEESVRALETARGDAAPSLRLRIDDALFACAEGLSELKDLEGAARLYEALYAKDRPEHVRTGALRGLVLARGPKALGLLVEAIRGEDPLLRANAIGFARELRGTETAAALAGLLETLDPDSQALVLGALGSIGEASATPQVIEATKSEVEDVRIAAYQALTSVAGARAVETLAQAAAQRGGREQQVARACLIQAGETGALLPLARASDRLVRHEAIAALGALIEPEDIDALMALLIRPHAPDDRPVLEGAVLGALRRVPRVSARAQAVLKALQDAPSEAKPGLVRLLSSAASDEALAAVRSAFAQEDPGLRRAALDALVAWPNASPAMDLLDLASTGSSAEEKALALRGYIRMAGLSESPTERYVEALKLADEPEDRSLVLRGLGAAGTSAALEVVRGYLEDPNEPVASEAALAAVSLADAIREKDAESARTVLAEIVRAARRDDIRQKAQEVINQIEQYDGYILQWRISGPYTEKGKESPAVLEQAFSPEDPAATNVVWKLLRRGVGSWDISLDNAVGQLSHCAAYMKTRVWSPEEQKVRLELGSDDAIKVWLNGEVVHFNYVNRGVGPRQDIVATTLRQGWNDVLIKVVNHEGGWGFCCRVRKPDGSALEGLKTER